MLPWFFEFEGVPDYANSSDQAYLSDDAGQPYDWTGKSFVLDIGRARNGGVPLVTLRQADGEIVADQNATGSFLQFLWTAAKLSILEGRTYELDLNYEEGGQTYAFAAGRISILQGVGA